MIMKKKTTEKISGAEAFTESLKAEGADVIFGYPGGSLLPIYDAIYKSGIRHILVRHEQAAAHAADGYARATGKPGVCLATSGPGATNLVTGIATANMDSSPVVAFTGQVSRSLIGNDAFQEADITGISLPVTKHNFLIQKAEDIPKAVKEAFHIASTGRKGPVLVDISKDATEEEVAFRYPETVNIRSYRPTIKGNMQQIRKAASLIVSAERPVICAGGGIISSGASETLQKLCGLIRAPVTTTLMGIGSVPYSHPLFLGMPGIHGTRYANHALQECDVLIAVGMRFDDRVTGELSSFAEKSRIIHIDIDPAEISKNVPVDVPIVGDAKTVLESLMTVLEDKIVPGKTDAWLSQIGSLKEKYPLTYRKRTDQDSPVRPQFVIGTICDLAPDAIIATDVGQHQMWTAQFFRFEKPRKLITSGGLGTMGFGLPAAMGAKTGCPDETVILISGDGSFQMNVQELATIASNRIAVISVIINNGYLGMVRQLQEFFCGGRYSQTDIRSSVDFVRLAEAYGIDGFSVDREEDFAPVFEKALALSRAGRPSVIDVHVDPEEDVFPMVAAGGSITDFVEEPADVKPADVAETGKEDGPENRDKGDDSE